MPSAFTEVNKSNFLMNPIGSEFDGILSNDLLLIWSQIGGVSPETTMIDLWPGMNVKKTAPLTCLDSLDGVTQLWEAPAGSTAVIEKSSELGGFPLLKTEALTSNAAEGLRTRLSPPLGSYSVFMPFKITSLTYSSCLFSLGGGGGDRITIYGGANGVALYHNHGNDRVYYSNIAIPVDTWMSLVVQHDTRALLDDGITANPDLNKASIYINGTAVGSLVITETAATYQTYCGFLGTGYTSMSSHAKSPGMRMWNGIRTLTEIASLTDAANRWFAL